MKTSSYYVFAVDKSNGDTIVTGSVNGEEVTVNNAYEQIATEIIEVAYDCGVCNDSVIEEIIITNVEEPKAGNTPDYLASAIGTGYKVANSNYDNYHIW